MTALSRALMTSWPVLPPRSSRATTSAISSGVTNSICSPVVIALNSSREKIPFSPVSMKTLCRVWPVGRPRAGSRGRKATPGHERLGLLQGHVVERHGPAAPQDLAEADALPGDGGRGLDLLGDGPAGRAGHQEEQQRVRAGQRALGEEHAGRLLLGVRVGDVEAHAARARGPDLDVGPRPRLQHGLVEDLDVADELRDVVGHQQRLQALAQVRRPARRASPGLPARLVDVLVGDAGGGVHGVHDDVGPDGGDELVEVVLRGRGLGERVEQALDERVARCAGSAKASRRGRSFDVREREDVAPGGLERRRLPPPARDRGHRLLGLLAAQREQDQPPGLLAHEAAGHGLAHQAVAAEDEDGLLADVHGLRPLRPADLTPPARGRGPACPGSGRAPSPRRRGSPPGTAR